MFFMIEYVILFNTDLHIADHDIERLTAMKEAGHLDEHVK
jgi:hypothetical protein